MFWETILGLVWVVCVPIAFYAFGYAIGRFGRIKEYDGLLKARDEFYSALFNKYRKRKDDSDWWKGKKSN